MIPTSLITGIRCTDIINNNVVVVTNNKNYSTKILTLGIIISVADYYKYKYEAWKNFILWRSFKFY